MNIDSHQQKIEPTKAKRLRRDGFTLVELLVVLVIIGILMGVVAGAIRSANQDTLVSKTRGTIAKIDSILNDRYDEYLSVPLNYQASGVSIVGHFPAPSATVAQLPFDPMASPLTFPPVSLLRERVRLAATRDLMRMEMPDCPADLVRVTANMTVPLEPRPGALIATGFRSNSELLYMQLPISARFGRLGTKMFPPISAAPFYDVSKVRENANSELLYLIIEDSILNGSSAIEAFGNSEIGDTDSDGLLELIDAWGTPIRWLRCPAGINSTTRFDPDPLHPAGTPPSDPLDPTQADVGYDTGNSGLGQRPLVVSAGVDKRFGIRFFGVDPSMSVSSPWFSTSAVTLSASTVPVSPLYWRNASSYSNFTSFAWPDPYAPRNFLNNGVDMRLGAVLDDTGTIDTVRDPIGVEYNVATATLIENPETDTRYFLHSQDNVSNLDESGASL